MQKITCYQLYALETVCFRCIGGRCINRFPAICTLSSLCWFRGSANLVLGRQGRHCARCSDGSLRHTSASCAAGGTAVCQLPVGSKLLGLLLRGMGSVVSFRHRHARHSGRNVRPSLPCFCIGKHVASTAFSAMAMSTNPVAPLWHRVSPGNRATTRPKSSNRWRQLATAEGADVQNKLPRSLARHAPPFHPFKLWPI